MTILELSIIFLLNVSLDCTDKSLRWSFFSEFQRLYHNEGQIYESEFCPLVHLWEAWDKCHSYI